MCLRNATARAARTNFALLLLVACGACFDIGVPLGPIPSSGSCTSCYYTIGLLVTPMAQNLLRGDTARASILSTTGNDRALWSISGNAIRLIRPDGSLDSVFTPATNSIRIKALQPGTAFLRARDPEGQFTDSSRITVVDSSDIVTLEAYRMLASDAQPTMGQEFDVQVVLRDAARRPYRAAPTSWSVSDTAVVDISAPTLGFEFGSAFKVRPKKVGTATVTFQFLNVRQTVDVSVVK